MQSSSHSSIYLVRIVCKVLLAQYSYASLGLIQNGEEEDINLIRNLVESYISRNQTIILITIPMTGLIAPPNSISWPARLIPFCNR